MARATQPDLLDWQPPVVVARYAPERVRGATWDARVARAISETLAEAAQAGMVRADVAARMSLYLGETVSLNMLNGYASNRKDHRISLPRFIALMHATADRRLLGLLAAECGWAVVEEKYLTLIDLAAAQEQERQFHDRARTLRKEAKSRGAL